jgi:flagellar L-ring protein FlgH
MEVRQPLNMANSRRTAICLIRKLACLSALVVAGASVSDAQDGSLLHRGGIAYNGSTAPAVNQPAMRSAMRPASQLQSPQPGAGAMPGGAPAAQPLPFVASSQNQGMTLLDSSFIYEPPAPLRTYQKNAIVTIRVDEISRIQADGSSESRRNTLYDALLKDWLKFDGLDSIKPAAQVDGDPRVQGSVNQLYRANATMQSREAITFNIAARVVDIRPSGELVLEARKTIVVNDNVFETSLSGICRPSDIAADNIVLSRDLLDLQIHKQERGRLRDGYKRGWFTKWFETLLPF